ncbi:MAG: SRPBCC family protein [Hyphomonadaceae bacterium]
MKIISLLAGAALAAGLAGTASAQGGTWPKPEYVSIPMEITVNKPAAEVWAKIGGYCDISKWITPTGGVPCEVTSGTGEVGSVRVIAGRVVEVMTAKSEMGYGYTQPAVEGKWYNLYHGFLEARPIDANTSKLVYTLMLDVADKADQAAKDADVAGRRKQFEAALGNMKKLAEAG